MGSIFSVVEKSGLDLNDNKLVDIIYEAASQLLDTHSTSYLNIYRFSKLSLYKLLL